MMPDNQVFYNFLNMVAPSQAKAFKKRAIGEGYETYDPIKKTGHRFVFDTSRKIIIHTYFVSDFDGFEYSKKPVTEEIRVIPTENGFRTIKV
jgi:hypothetical protein